METNPAVELRKAYRTTVFIGLAIMASLGLNQNRFRMRIKQVFRMSALLPRQAGTFYPPIFDFGNTPEKL